MGTAAPSACLRVRVRVTVGVSTLTLTLPLPLPLPLPLTLTLTLTLTQRVPAAEGRCRLAPPRCRSRQAGGVLEARVADKGAAHAGAAVERALEWEQEQKLVEPAGQPG